MELNCIAKLFSNFDYTQKDRQHKTYFSDHFTIIINILRGHQKIKWIKWISEMRLFMQ